MSVITKANKAQGQARQSFNWSQGEQKPIEATTTPDPAQHHVGEPKLSEAQKLAMLEHELLALPKEKREALLQSLFASELQAIVKAERQKGFDQGLQEGQAQWQATEDKLKQELIETKASLERDLTEAVKTFGGAAPVIELKDESVLIDIVYSAVLKIIEVQLVEAEYVREVVKTLAEEFSGQETLKLCLCARDRHILDELNLQSLLPANMKVIEEDNLLPGSYRIHIEGGAIESKLDEKLKNFKTLLLDTYNRKGLEL